MVRMVVGSVLGVVGFGTLSYGFVGLHPPTMLVGVTEIGVGSLLALGVLAPLRKQRRRSRGS